MSVFLHRKGLLFQAETAVEKKGGGKEVPEAKVEVETQEEKRLKYAYYPGCSLTTSAKDYNLSVLEVFRHLDVELAELEDWSCCGATAAYSVSHLLSLALPARNLALAEKEKQNVVAACPECYYRLWAARDSMRDDPKVMEEVNRALEGTGLEFKGEIDIKHILDILVNDVGLERIQEKVVRPLRGLKVVPYYGCVVVKPPRKARFDSPENPTTMDRLIEALGAECVPWDEKTKCCGGPLMLTNEPTMLELTRSLFQKAKGKEGQCVVLLCQLCHMALDGKQSRIEEVFGEKIGMPVLYFTQLMGLAFGIEPKKLGLDKGLVSTKSVLETLGIEG
jgi:heterodisulfide reductase subunit B